MAEGIGSSGKTEYLALAKSVKGAAAADLISRALEHPGLYTFAELLEMPNVAQLAGSQHEAALGLLRLFAYGDYQEYKGRFFFLFWFCSFLVFSFCLFFLSFFFVLPFLSFLSADLRWISFRF